MRSITLILSLGWMLVGTVNAALQFDFDYQYDSHGFFDDPARRDAMEAAGRLVNWYVDDLAAIVPEGDNGWSAWFDPPDGSNSIVLNDSPVPAGTMRIFPAGRSLALSGGTTTLAQAYNINPLGLPIASRGGDLDWINTVENRGQLGAEASPATDFGPMGGAMSFNLDPSEVDWHFGLSTAGLNSNEFDFITVAMHELMHVLGFGTSDSFEARINSSGEFTGPQAVQAGSSTNPNLKLDVGEAHWTQGTKSPWNGSLQESVVSVGIFPGSRVYPTRLDRAALVDIGWESATAGDANLDRSFDSTDLVEVLGRGLYETGQLAGWSDGDWNDNARFESGDLVEALLTGTYEQTPLLAVEANGEPAPFSELTVTVRYESASGELAVESSSSALAALRFVSSQHRFLQGAASNLEGPFDVSRSDTMFAMNLNGFDHLDLGSVLPPDLSLNDLKSDLTISGAWLGGGAVEPSHVVFVPEPATLGMLALSVLPALAARRQRDISARDLT